ncbi:MAG: NlpC/P60 family protein [Thermodesulfobacteriota bacterium]
MLFPIIVATLLSQPLTGCAKSTVRYDQPPPSPVAKTPASSARQAVLEKQLKKWQGVPYRYGGLSKKGIDCSGLVHLIYRDTFHIKLPRSTKDQVGKGRSISRAELTPGDLVFFKIPGKGRHVGIYLDKNRFLHASTTKGVLTSRLDNPYWQENYWQSRRVLK